MTGRLRRRGRSARRTRPRDAGPGWFGLILRGAAVGLFGLSIAWHLRPSPPSPPVPPETPVRMVIVNGCGKPRLAAVCKQKLLRRAHGTVEILDLRSAPVMDHVHTVVIAHGDHADRARYVAGLVGADSVRNDPPAPGVEVTLLLGCDFQKLFPGEQRWWATP